MRFDSSSPRKGRTQSGSLLIRFPEFSDVKAHRGIGPI
ncbi:hypothetical protein VPHD518_0067 [Vibrio phage D518]